VIGVLHRLEVEEERRMAEHAKGGGGEHRAFEAVGGALAQDGARRPRGARGMIGHGVEGTLDAPGTA
jgi:hypothetical protein